MQTLYKVDNVFVLRGVRAVVQIIPNQLKKSGSKRGSVQVYEKLREEILWLKIAPGSAVDEVALAERFAVSRTPIREALVLLAGEGLIQTLPNRTSIVSPLSLHNVGAFLDIYLLISRGVIRSILHNFDESRREELKGALAELCKTGSDWSAEGNLRATLTFLRLLAALAENEFQEKYYRNLLDMRMRAMILHYYPNMTSADLEERNELWVKLVDAISGGMAQVADHLMVRIIKDEIDVILRSQKPKFGHDMELTPPSEFSGAENV